MTDKLFHDFEGYDRFGFPEGYVRVTAGIGGEAVLITKYGKSILMDCGMAFCGDKLVENIKKVLGDRKLDMIFVSHTHYDHIGALPNVLKAYPDAVVYGSEKAKSVFQRQGALDTIKFLGEQARDSYGNGKEDISVEGMRIDVTMSDGDRADIGGGTITALETKGHTNCCLTYAVEPDSIMFLSETTGVLEGTDARVDCEILTGFESSLASAYKCRAYKAKTYVCPHYGIIPENYVDRFFDDFIKCAVKRRDDIARWYASGLDEDQVVEKYKETYYNEVLATEQPLEAFLANARATVSLLK